MGVPEYGTGSVAELASAVLADLRTGRDPLSVVEMVCRACVALLPVDGAAMSVIVGTAHRHSLYVTDAVAERLEAVQFSLGEGPCFEALETGQPVLVPDLCGEGGQAWPVFTEEVGSEKVGALFAFPLRRGAARAGSIDLYRRVPGWLSEKDVAVALTIADIATSVILAASVPGPNGQSDMAWLMALSRNRVAVHQATGMVIAELRIPAAEALARLRGYAFATGRLLDDVAEDVLAGRLSPREIDL